MLQYQVNLSKFIKKINVFSCIYLTAGSLSVGLLLLFVIFWVNMCIVLIWLRFSYEWVIPLTYITSDNFTDVKKILLKKKAGLDFCLIAASTANLRFQTGVINS